MIKIIKKRIKKKKFSKIKNIKIKNYLKIIEIAKKKYIYKRKSNKNKSKEYYNKECSCNN